MFVCLFVCVVVVVVDDVAVVLVVVWFSGDSNKKTSATATTATPPLNSNNDEGIARSGNTRLVQTFGNIDVVVAVMIMLPFYVMLDVGL